MPSFRPISIRRATTAALAGAMLISLLPAATMGYSAPSDSIKDAEQTVLKQMNELRGRNGLAPLRMADGVRIVARDRSRDMRDKHYFDHTSPSGDDAGKMLRRRGIGHAFWGENIGWTMNMGLQDGARWMVDWWKDSPGHRAAMLSRSYNYVGVGVANAGAKILYTIVFVNQPDHTAPKAKITSVRTGATVAGAGGRKAVTIKWSGKDRRLSTRTAGLKGFVVQYKKKGTRDWTRIRRLTTARELTTMLPSGNHKFRIRAKDRRGNKTKWQGPVLVRVR